MLALAHIVVGDTLLLFSSAEDQQVLVWECKLGAPAEGLGPGLWFGHWSLRQKVEAGGGLQHCLAVSDLPGQPGW